MSHEADEHPEPTNDDHSLRGTMVAVLLMAAFFIAAWLGVFALLQSRR